MKQTKSAAARIRAYVKQHPNAKAKDIAAALKNVSVQNVHQTLWFDRKNAQAKTPLEKPTVPPIVTYLLKDNVNNPAHYKVGGIETIDFIEAKNLGYNLGNVVKYVTRADHKGNKLEDLRKAQWYLLREIWNAEDEEKAA